MILIIMLLIIFMKQNTLYDCKILFENDKKRKSIKQICYSEFKH